SRLLRHDSSDGYHGTSRDGGGGSVLPELRLRHRRREQQRQQQEQEQRRSAAGGAARRPGAHPGARVACPPAEPEGYRGGRALGRVRGGACEAALPATTTTA